MSRVPCNCSDFHFMPYQTFDMNFLLIMRLSTPEEAPNTCTDLTTNEWIVWLQRLDNAVSFNRPWADYKEGFGDKDGNFWLGLDHLHTITNTGTYKLRAELESWAGETKWAEYGLFRVAHESDTYKLAVVDYNSSSSAPDKMWMNTNKLFTTEDREQ